jgi:hypothetical protein
MKPILLCLLCLLGATGAGAYEILLDIDLDNDPTTLNELTWDTETLVRLILNPTVAGEVVGRIEFGLGGSCRECSGVHEYGVAHDLADWTFQPWIQASGWTSGYDGITLLGCPGDVGYHEVYWGEPIAGTVTLTAPVVLAEFTARVADPVLPGCTQPQANLGCFGSEGLWNYIQIGGPALTGDTARWGAIKALYR